ncbi:MAG: hypothetical protein NVSMB27_23750 [Ktedonobacteraceae bacterium]
MQEVQTTLPVGSVIRDRYVIESVLGKGGFGVIYRVSDLRVQGNHYALKEVIEPRRNDRTVKEKNRFIFESDVLKRLDHRALPRVFHVFEDSTLERAYMLMDFIDGPNLDILRQQLPGKRFTLSQVMTIMAPIVDAINYLHGQQPPIIHRDIKPANIIVPTPHTAMLVDFDIAKEFDPDTTTTAVRRCSPGYGAPEQYGQGTSTLTDIYGLGATIYTLLTGVTPPDALQRMTLLNAKGNDPLIPIDQLVPTIPKNVAESVQRAMSLHSNDRFPSIEHFWQTFDTYATANELPATFVTRSTWSKAFAVSHDISEITTAIRAKKLSPLLPSLSSPSSSPQIPISPPPTTQPPITPPPITIARKRKRFPIILALLLALFVALSSGVGLWFLFGHSQIPLPVTPTLGPSFTPGLTTSTTTSPIPDPTNISTSVVISGRVLPTHTPTMPSTSISPTPVPPTTIPTAVPTPRPRPTPTPTPNPYPRLAGIYHGTIVDTTPSPNITTGMSLSSISQNNGNISGYFTVNAPLVGSGPFTGTIDSNKYIQFTVQSYHGNAPLYFWGFVQQNSSLQGQYCSLDQSGHCSAYVGAGGYWSVTPG